MGSFFKKQMEKKNNFNVFKYTKFNPSVNEWKTSIYTYDKTFLNLSNINKFIYDLFNVYFNKKLFLPLKKKVHSLKIIFISIPDIKYNINSINITLYIFNKEKFALLYKLYKMKSKNFNYKFLFRNYYKNKKNLNNINNINSINLNKLVLFNSDNGLIKNNFNNLILNNFNVNLVLNILNKNYYKLYLYKLYICKLYFNKFKFNFVNIINLRKLLHIFFNKNININIVNMKYLYLDNDLYVDGIVRKLKDRKRKALVLLRRAYVLVNIPVVNSLILLRKKININKYKHNLPAFNQMLKRKDINKNIFISLKSTHLVGMRLEGKGRLTRRLTASRAILKRTYEGNLKNIFSSYQGLSSTISKGYQKSNVEYTNHNSHNNNGSFGIKSWHNTF